MKEYAREKQTKEKEATRSAVIERQCHVDEEGDGDDNFVHPWSNPLKKNIPWDPDPSKVDYNSILFDHFFP